jgi:cytochrome c
MKVQDLAAVVAAALACAAPAVGQAASTSNPGNPDSGAELYSTECRGCHAVSIAPTLRGLINRPAASVMGFTGYSEALKAKAAAGLTWSEVNISAFIAAPQEFAPGTLMTKVILDPQQRSDIIAYIASLPPPRQ